MKTNFFQNIAELNIPGNWKITIQTEDNIEFTVSALFTALKCGDNAAKAVPPMLLKGTAEELSEGFFDTITVPVIQTAGLYTNMETYLQGLEQARLASKIEQDKKAKEKAQANSNPSPKKTEDIELPEPKISKEDKKKAYDEAMEKVTELIKKFKFTDALEILPSIEDYPNKENELKKKAQYLKQQGNLYEKAFETFNA